jgi:putative ABC transport system substrate-binding protein
MRRFHALLLLLASVTLAGAPVAAQRLEHPRVGLLSLHKPAIERAGNIGASAFRTGMEALGYIEGRNFELHERHADGVAARLALLAEELVAEGVDVIVTLGTDATHAARQATPTIPIVMAGVGDPVRSGFVAGLARPGMNITGTALSTEETAVKQLEALKEAAPRVQRIAVLRRPIGGHERMINSFKNAEALLGIAISEFVIATPDDLPRRLEEMRVSAADGLVALPSPLLDDLRGPIGEFALRNRLPAAGWQPAHAQAGFLVSYGPNLAQMHARSVSYVDRILKGTKPADLPVEQPERFQLTINVKTAKAFGLTIPPTLLARADEVIE